MTAFKYYFCYFLFLLGLITYFFIFAFGLPIIIAYLLSINTTSALLVIIDKSIAKTKSYRIPENLMYLMSLLGSALIILVTCYLFKHKYKKDRFIIINFVILLLQIVLFNFIKYSYQ
jgi:uncharacterized membrane protein YsdA (DUF1294 family)